MNGIKEVLNKYITIKRIGKHGKFVVLNTSIANLEKELIKRSEQLKTESKPLDFNKWIKKLGYKKVNDATYKIGNEFIWINDVLEMYEEYVFSF